MEQATPPLCESGLAAHFMHILLSQNFQFTSAGFLSVFFCSAEVKMSSTKKHTSKRMKELKISLQTKQGNAPQFSEEMLKCDDILALHDAWLSSGLLVPAGSPPHLRHNNTFTCLMPQRHFLPPSSPIFSSPCMSLVLLDFFFFLMFSSCLVRLRAPLKQNLTDAK